MDFVWNVRARAGRLHSLVAVGFGQRPHADGTAVQDRAGKFPAQL